MVFESQRGGWVVEMAQLLRALAALEEDQLLFPVPKRQFTTVTLVPHAFFRLKIPVQFCWSHFNWQYLILLLGKLLSKKHNSLFSIINI